MNQLLNSTSIYRVGCYDPDIDLFESQYVVPQGVTYNSYVIVDEKVAILDTVDPRKTQEWLANLDEVLGDRQPDYLVVHHMEPDHAGSVAQVAQRYPQMKLIGNAKTFPMLKQFTGVDYTDRAVVVKEGDVVELGEHSLTFVMAPMVHWPEAMVSYEAKEKVLFSADGFGRFGAGNPETEWVEEARRYYLNIVGKFGPQVQALLKKAAALEKIRAECDEQVKKFTAEGKLIEAQRIAQRTNYDIEMLNEVGVCKGIENYSAVLSGRAPGSMPTTLLDYFPKDFLLFVDESHVTLPQVRAMYGGDYARKKTLVEYGFRLPSAFDNRPLKFEEVESKLNQTIFVSATPGPYEQAHSTQVAEQVIRPTGLLDPPISVRPVEGQVTDLLGEIRARVERDERVLVTTLTKKMAEDLTDYLTGQGVKVKYMHHEVDTFERMELIRDLRMGAIDVIVGINLLREGLDLPEVSLVAILDADKEGFLRSETSLIQTIGRAARNADGLVIMYADTVTDSMERAITETERRRAIQTAYNQAHGITPRTIVKEIRDTIEISDKAENAKANTRRMGKKEREAAIERLTREMKEAAKLLQFEHAAFLRDQIDRLRRGENPTTDSDAEAERRQNHAQSQRKGRKYFGKR